MNTQRDISTVSGCRGRGVCGHDKPSIPEQTWPQTPRPRHPHGFTLVELLVIIGIIAMLVGILLPALDKFIFASEKAKTQSAINLIDGACRYYFNDFGDYPPSRDATDYNGWYGSELIVLFLTGYGPDKDDDGVPDVANLDTDDGVDGYGFRLKKRGYVYGPYPGTEELPVRSGSGRPEFVDVFGESGGNPILYYRWTGSGYTASHNQQTDTATRITQTNLNTYTRNSGGSYYRTDFILISRGRNEEWDAPQAGRSDDVTNFFNK